MYLPKKLRVVMNRLYLSAASKFLGGHKFADVDHHQDAVSAIIYAAISQTFTVRDMQRAAWANSEAHGFHKVPALDAERLNFALKLLLIVCEVAEAWEEVRSGRHALNETYYRTDGKPEGVPAELADIAIRLGDLCGIAKVDLQDAVKEKAAYNAGRPMMHGKTC